jgi:hypothetical protein
MASSQTFQECRTASCAACRSARRAQITWRFLRILKSTQSKIIAEALLWADQIAFLGFGYHEQNLDLLTPAAAIPSKPVYGTGKDWSDNDRDEIQGRLHRMFKPAALGSHNPKPAITIDTKVTCAGLFDNYGQSLTGR